MCIRDRLLDERSLNSKSRICIDICDVSVFSSVPGRLIRKIHGNQVKNNILTWNTDREMFVSGVSTSVQPLTANYLESMGQGGMIRSLGCNQTWTRWICEELFSVPSE